MHIRRVEIENIRSVKHLVWELPLDIWRRQNSYGKNLEGAGWHVVLGDNGLGKTSFLRGTAICWLSFLNVIRAVQSEPAILRIGEDFYRAEIIITIDKDFDTVTDFNGFPKIYDPNKNGSNYKFPEFKIEKKITRFAGGDSIDYETDISRTFFISFGHNRNFSKDNFSEEIKESNPSLFNQIGIFQSLSYEGAISWILKLSHAKAEGDLDSERNLENILNFINNTNILPEGCSISSVSSKGIFLKRGNGSEIPINQMSDGYLSVLSMVIEILKQINKWFGFEKMFRGDDYTEIIVPGVVQIDEVDAHLHPSWQRRIGQWFKEHFPNMQFIVTTHSPLICWAADSVFVLPTPGTDETGRFLTEEELNRVKYGSIQEAYMLDAFGEIGRSDEGQKKLVRLTELNNKEWDGQLTEADKKELQELRAALPLSALRMKG
ncbi:AAA family ATPase [Armatimonas sp.]|uniref:AAA family ATPase n=1 Tax=Armatimonas sp. TaxID=1872638 RepID=UPI00375151A3